jgi:hypothetical protein
MLRPPRTHGCQPPLSLQQICTAAIWVAITALALLVFALYGAPSTVAFTIAVYGVLALCVLLCYAYCSCADVTAAGGVPCPCLRATQAIERFDPRSNAAILGFDHHCAFLNVAIGKKNYAFFYLLSLFGTLQFLWHAVAVSLVAAGPWRAEGANNTSAVVFAAIVAVLALAPLVAFGRLLQFHTNLLVEGIGTYEWLLRQREEQRSRAQHEAVLAHGRALVEEEAMETARHPAPAVAIRSPRAPTPPPPPPLQEPAPSPSSSPGAGGWTGGELPAIYRLTPPPSPRFDGGGSGSQGFVTAQSGSSGARRSSSPPPPPPPPEPSDSDSSGV